MYKNCSPIKHTQFSQPRNFGMRALIGTFSSVKNEWPVSRSTLPDAANIWTEIE
jgi:hypothetical protein